MIRFCCLNLMLVVATSSSATLLSAQWEIDVAKRGATVTATAPKLQSGEHFKFEAATEVLTVKCTNLSCKDDVQVAANPAGPELSSPSVTPNKDTSPSDASASFTVIGDRVAQSKQPVVLEIRVTGTDKPIASFLMEALEQQPNPTITAAISLNDLLVSPACLNSNIEPSGNEFVVSPNGDILGRPPTPINEGQKVIVEIVADQRLVPQLHAQRSSAFRTVRISNILSGSVTVPTEVITAAGKQALTSENAACDRATFQLADFAPGQATVEISALTDKGKQALGTFDFTVDELYTGAFILGGIWTSVRNSSFGKTTIRRDTVVGGVNQEAVDTVITETDKGGPRFLYAVTYTPFIWGERDVKVGLKNWYEHFNPAVGLALNDISNNAMAGVDFDMWNRIYVIYGLHVGRVTELDPRAKLTLGSVIANTPVPTRRAWETGWFWGVGVDLQAGIDLFHSILSGGNSNANKS